MQPVLVDAYAARNPRPDKRPGEMDEAGEAQPFTETRHLRNIVALSARTPHPCSNVHRHWQPVIVHS